MSIDPRAIADETGVDEEDVLAVLDALAKADDAADDPNSVDPDDSFWSLLGTFPEGGPTDAARNHDKYLYGEKRPE